MPTVDFTLEDFRTIVKEEIQAEVPGIVSGIVSDMLLGFWEHNLEPVLNGIYDELSELKTEVKGIKRVVRKHAADIEELQTATGLR